MRTGWPPLTAPCQRVRAGHAHAQPIGRPGSPSHAMREGPAGSRADSRIWLTPPAGPGVINNLRVPVSTTHRAHRSSKPRGRAVWLYRVLPAVAGTKRDGRRRALGAWVPPAGPGFPLWTRQLAAIALRVTRSRHYSQCSGDWGGWSAVSRRFQHSGHRVLLGQQPQSVPVQREFHLLAPFGPVAGQGGVIG